MTTDEMKEAWERASENWKKRADLRSRIDKWRYEYIGLTDRDEIAASHAIGCEMEREAERLYKECVGLEKDIMIGLDGRALRISVNKVIYGSDEDCSVVEMEFVE